jgi:hypothetical protein
VELAPPGCAGLLLSISPPQYPPPLSRRLSRQKTDSNRSRLKRDSTDTAWSPHNGWDNACFGSSARE